MTERCGKWMPRAKMPCVLPVGHKDGHRGTDRKDYLKDYSAKNRDRAAAVNKAYRAAHRERLAALDKVYREANRERDAANRRAYREANLELVRDRERAYTNSERGKEARKRYAESGYQAESAARSRRRKADEADNRLEKELLGWLV